MDAFWSALVRTIKGERKINERRKYTVSSIVLTMVHFFFMCLFLVYNVRILFIYNFLAVLFYATIAILTVRVSQYTYMFAATFIEIMLHSMLASVMLGWDWGFMTYIMGLVPLSFYITYTVDYFKKKLSIPVIASGLVFVGFLIVREITSRYGALLNRYFPEKVVHGTYLFNMMLTFGFLWAIAFLFSLEVYYMQHNLENENISLEQLANYDPLTQLMNRRSMDAYLEESRYRAMKKHETFCIVMADIDDFKKVNDTYGHAAGDKVLVEVSSVITGEVRDNDCVCRWGGEEIVILIRSDMERARMVAERICNEVAHRNIDIGPMYIKVTMTLGIAQFREGESIDEVVERADKCMYDGKIRGKNRVVCD
ncbi:MAG: GGDEF domain-containing protein [Lachnospiraceae bacterium]|nr:GGDEF domain-containing protein [Lachnospiraceae bacterium]